MTFGEFDVLGQTVREPITAAELETFDAPPGCSAVSFQTNELTAFCPVTHQPDYYTLTIRYVPTKLCIESKSLKLYLMGFRDRGLFGEHLVVEIADAILVATLAAEVTVTAVQQARGGLVMTATASTR